MLKVTNNDFPFIDCIVIWRKMKAKKKFTGSKIMVFFKKNYEQREIYIILLMLRGFSSHNIIIVNLTLILMQFNIVTSYKLISFFIL